MWLQIIIFIIPCSCSIYHKNIGHGNRHTPHFLSLQRLLNLLFLPFQVILLLVQIIALFTKFFHAFQLRPHSLLAIRLYLLIFPGQIANYIIVFLYLLRQAYPVYQILHFLVRFVKVCFCYDFSTQPYHNFLFHIRHILSIPFPIGSFQRHVSGVSLPFLPALTPLTVPLSTAPVPCLNDAPNAPNQTLFPAIGLWCRSAP